MAAQLLTSSMSLSMALSSPFFLFSSSVRSVLAASNLTHQFEKRGARAGEGSDTDVPHGRHCTMSGHDHEKEVRP